MSATRPIFRVFFSSTFSDFAAERNALQNRVFPELRRYCSQRGASFLPIDLRWGISEAARSDQLTLGICLDEIHRCQETSPNFNFVALIGDRYGSRLLPGVIPRDDLDKLLTVIPLADQPLVRRWYFLDTNGAPPSYVLASRANDPSGWRRDSSQLRNLLISASGHAEISAETRLSLRTSVIEQEIHAGILRAREGNAAICFMRQITSPPVSERSPQFFEAGEGERQQLADLKRRLADYLPDRIVSYDASWSDGQLNPNYLDHFCEIAEFHLRARIDDVLEGRRASEVDQDNLLRWGFARNLLEWFTGRGPELGDLAGYVSNGPPVPLVISGAPGTGKTTLLLRAAVQAGIAHPEALHLHYFIGGNTPIREVGLFLQNLTSRLLGSYAHPEDLAIPDDPFMLEMKLSEFLQLANSDRPLIIFVDGLDLLSDHDPTRWLPRKLPDYVRIIVSVTSGRQADRLSRRIPDLPVLALETLSPSEGEQLLRKWLHGAGRTLTSPQWAAVLLSITENSLPLYLRLLFEEIRHWRSYQRTVPDIPADVPTILVAIFTRLESPSRHGQLLVSRSLGLIAAGRYGLAEDELLDVLGKDSDVLRQLAEAYPLAPQVDHLPTVLWARLYSDLDALLIDREAQHSLTFGFYHSQVDEAIRARYLTDGPARHAALAQHFSTQRPYIAGVNDDLQELVNERMVGELAYQLWRAGRSYQLRQTLLDAEFVQASIVARHTAGAVDDMALMADDPEVEPLGYALQLSAITLDRAPEELWNQIHGRTKDLEEFLHNWPARRKPNFTLLSRSLCQSEGHLLAALIGHSGPINGCTFTRDGRYAVSASSDTTLRLWDLALGRTLRLFRGHSAPVLACAIEQDDRFMVSASDDRTLRLWDLTTGEALNVFTGHSDAVTCCALSPDARYALSGSKDKTLRLWDLTTGEALNVFTGHSDAVTCCALSPDAR
ncbi:AAA family ATPase, partial [Streptomyces sp. NPDC002740]